MCIWSLRHISKPLENITGIVSQIAFGKFSEYVNSTVFITQLLKFKSAFDYSENLTSYKSIFKVYFSLIISTAEQCS